jgi:formylglycine-generating enzyme required for sulfatase activity
LHEPGLNWRNPGFGPQIDSHPVVAVSWNDAASYCNWLSRSEGLPVAYDLESGSMLDEEGNPTDDVRIVKGYRLPTEAEWEFAARERGRKVRFGTGKDIARSSEINFRADTVTHSFTELGDYRRGTTPVGSLLHNSLGLYDMSGNAWEWTSDCFSAYSSEAQTNPHPAGCEMRALRGGRWGGDAAEIRVFCRSGWHRNDRCNNSGFRIARSAF